MFGGIYKKFVKLINVYFEHTLKFSQLQDKPLLTVVWLVPTCLVFMWITIKSILAIETMEKGFLYYGVNLITVGKLHSLQMCIVLRLKELLKAFWQVYIGVDFISYYVNFSFDNSFIIF